MAQQGQGDILAQADGFLEPAGVDFSYKTWRNYPVSDETMDEKSKKGGERENITYPTITINTPTSATSADNYTFSGSVNDHNAQIHSLSYELTGGNNSSGLITSGNFLRRTSRPFGGTWRLPVSPIAVGQTVLFMRGRNVKGRWGPIRDSSITRTPTASPVIPCGCGVFEDVFSSLNANDWLLDDVAGMTVFGANGWEHNNNEDNYARIRGNGGAVPWVVGGDFDICCEVVITEIPDHITLSHLYFSLSEGVKGGAAASIKLATETPSSGTLQYQSEATNGNFDKANFGSFRSGTTHLLRFTRTGNTVKAFVWNEGLEQWDWDGDTAGNTCDGVFDLDPYVLLEWNDVDPATGDYLKGAVKYFCINDGTKID